jgi:hypothetical protein
MQAYGRSTAIAPLIFNLALGGGEWSVSRSGRFIVVQRAIDPRSPSNTNLD